MARWRGTTRRGFTLVEALVTLAFLGLALPAVIRGFEVSVFAAGRAARQAEATQLARGLLAEAVAGGVLPDAPAEGDFGEDWPGYRWELDITDWEGQEIQQVDVYVLWTQRDVERFVRLSTLAYMPSE